MRSTEYTCLRTDATTPPPDSRSPSRSRALCQASAAARASSSMRATVNGLEMVWPKPIGKRDVFVGAMGQGFVDENVARNFAHRVEHDLVLDPLVAQALDHAHARALRGHPDAGMLVAHRARGRCVGWPAQRPAASAATCQRGRVIRPSQPRTRSSCAILGQVDLQRRDRYVALGDTA